MLQKPRCVSISLFASKIKKTSNFSLLTIDITVINRGMTTPTDSVEPIAKQGFSLTGKINGKKKGILDYVRTGTQSTKI